MPYFPIETYGLIGDMHTVALVSPEASIDYLCLPQFDSPTVFAALLDSEKGGRFRISPSSPGRVRQFYVPDTNILLTRFLSEDGVAEVMDFMPTPEAQHAHRVVRMVTAVRGRIPFQLVCDPRFDYARTANTVQIEGNQVLFHSPGRCGTALCLHSAVPVSEIDGGAVAAEFTLRADAGPVSFVLEVAREGEASVVTQAGYADRAFRTTLAYWRGWMARSAQPSRWTSAVNRSALAMKLLTSQPHGSIAAAATFGLPEGIGGERNWDYRYTWIRDASLTAATMVDMGYTEEPRRYAAWLADRLKASADGKLQIMYGIDGRTDLHEEILSDLSGYMDSAPVRMGNGAYNQLQLDIYGEMMLFFDRFDAKVEPIYRDVWHDLARSIDWVAANWDQVDEGVWEVRGGRQKFLYSRLMDWVALDRAVKIAERRSVPAPIVSWREERDKIHREIYTHFWDDTEKIFVQTRNGKTLDASCLLMPLVGFIGPRDPRWLSTLDAIGRDLVDDSLVYRYRTKDAASDGLSGTEGTFSMCTFWYVDCLARAGRLEEARLIFEKMLHYAGPLGLYAEELGATGEHLGNYPQAFTHLGLVGAARSLDSALDEAESAAAPRSPNARADIDELAALPLGGSRISI